MSHEATKALRSMQHHKLVLPEHMNHQGSLFGGNLLMWIDEVAYMTAALHYPGLRFVTVALDNVEFKHRIDCGEIICFKVDLERQGNSSITYFISVRNAREDKDTVLFETRITFVCIDELGNKCPIE
ncbi:MULTISPECIES: acyl-CoA thioesterase [unclassified Oleiphilus]|uniref:acyl-CoA thioesterase n=1 Tax=unclassified Oleiphilus TaxID=2631174 RepID=UPI000ACBE7BB|nr:MULTISPECIES: acyl-CoA thioesterase [unclassified Oleiphilus]